MGRVTLYSSSRRGGQERPSILRAPDPEAPSAAPEAAQPAPAAPAPRRWLAAVRRFDKPLLVMLGALLAAGVFVLVVQQRAPPRTFTQSDIDAAVLHTLETKTLPSSAARAYATVRPSVVRVRQLGEPKDGESDVEKSVGSGVVIVDTGIILTNLHVVAGGDRLSVTFYDGTESEATVVGVQP